MESKTSDALQQPPSFDDMVGLIKKLFTDYLTDIQKNAFTAEEIEKAWERYKTLNHLWQDEATTGPRWVRTVERLPGWGKYVKWRHESGKELPGRQSVHSMTDRDHSSLHGFEWLDEQPAAGEQWVKATDTITAKMVNMNEVEKLKQEHADLNLALAAMLNGYQNLSMYQKDWFAVPKDLIDAYTKMVLEYEQNGKEGNP